MKSIVTKLVIYKKDPRFDYCPTPYYCEGHFVGGGKRTNTPKPKTDKSFVANYQSTHQRRRFDTRPVRG